MMLKDMKHVVEWIEKGAQIMQLISNSCARFDDECDLLFILELLRAYILFIINVILNSYL